MRAAYRVRATVAGNDSSPANCAVATGGYISMGSRFPAGCTSAHRSWEVIAPAPEQAPVEAAAGRRGTPAMPRSGRDGDRMSASREQPSGRARRPCNPRPRRVPNRGRRSRPAARLACASSLRSAPWCERCGPKGHQDGPMTPLPDHEHRSPFPQVTLCGAGGARTHDRGIMSESRP